MAVDRRFLGWGVFFLVLGLIPLVVELGWVDASVVAGWWQLWPFVLIGIGVGMLLRRTPLAFAGGLIVAATFGLVLGSLLVVGPVIGRFDIGGCGTGGRGTAFKTQSGTFGNQADVSIEMNCGQLVVQTGSDRRWTVAGTSPNGRSPDITSGEHELSIRPAGRSGFQLFGPGSGEDWTVSVPQQTPLSLNTTLNAGSLSFDLFHVDLPTFNLTTNAGSATVDLSGAFVDHLGLTLNAGNIEVTFNGSNRLVPDTAPLTGSATVNAGRLVLCAPGSSFGFRFTTNDSVAASNNFAEQGLTKSGSTWTSAGYDEAAVKLDLSITANLGRVELNPEDGCQ